MKHRLCHWLYRHGFFRLAYKVSPGFCGYLAGRDLLAGIQTGVVRGRGSAK